MANFKPETLQIVKKLYLQYLGYVPEILENADEQLKLVKREDFLSTSYRGRGYSHFIYSDFQADLGSTALSPAFAPKGFLSGPDFRTPVHLLIKEFLQWHDSLKDERQKRLEEVIEAEKRIALFDALFDELFVSDNKIMIPGTVANDRFSEISGRLKSFMARQKHELDMFDVHELLSEQKRKLHCALIEFKSQLALPEGNKYAALLHANFNREVTQLWSCFSNLAGVFNDLRHKNWLLDRSEQSRQDMRVRMELVAHQIETVKWAIRLITDDIAVKEIDHLLTATIPAGLDLLKWHVATEEGRLYGIKQLSDLYGGFNGLDIHQVHNPLTKEAKQAFMERYGSSSSSSPSM